MTAPCGCGGNAAINCNCVIMPGANTQVSGTGTGEDPYIVTAGTTALTVTDTDTLDLSLSGDGSGGAPYNVSGAVRLAPNNLITQGANGLLVACGPVQDCVAAVLGDGLAWDAGARRINARPSADAGNDLGFGSDGGLYVSTAGANPPAQRRATIGRTSSFANIPSNAGTTTAVVFDQVLEDVGGMTATASRITFTQAGGYTFGFTTQWQNHGANNGHRASFVRLNGATLILGDQRTGVSGVSTIQNGSRSRTFAVGDYIELIVQHTQGVVSSLVAGNDLAPLLWAFYTTEGA